MLSVIKSRFTLLNVVRLFIVVILTGEAIHSETWVLLLIALVFTVQIFLNQKCNTSC